MAALPEIDADREQLTEWRRDLHAHPELAYEEKRTSAFVAAQLRSLGLDVDVGLARTGVVATLSTGDGPSIGLRADMDALPMHEANRFLHRSRFDGRMHACGHDGHTVMLLGAARHLAAHAKLKGTVRFIFQPAEEAAGGASAMIEDGLFEKFPVDRVFGMHNWPGFAAGTFVMRPGPMMASIDCFDAVITGRGAHGALPHHGVDPVLAFAQTVGALQSIVSRNVNPLRAAVLSVTKVHGGDAHNIIPESVSFGGAVRAFEPEVRSYLKSRLAEVVSSVAASLGASASVAFTAEFPAVSNDADSTTLAAAAAAQTVGPDAVNVNVEPILGSEDFSLMLERRPGCYVFIGNGDGPGSCMIHNASYDFNDDILTLGSTYWVRLAEAFLANRKA